MNRCSIYRDRDRKGTPRRRDGMCKRIKAETQQLLSFMKTCKNVVSALKARISLTAFILSFTNCRNSSALVPTLAVE